MLLEVPCTLKALAPETILKKSICGFFNLKEIIFSTFFLKYGEKQLQKQY
jgi:hypothetical protein